MLCHGHTVHFESLSNIMGSYDESLGKDRSNTLKI
jgi:hypothetical protein